MKRRNKYEKTHTDTWICEDCGYKWKYKTLRCPICGSKNIRKLNE